MHVYIYIYMHAKMLWTDLKYYKEKTINVLFWKFNYNRVEIISALMDDEIKWGFLYPF